MKVRDIKNGHKCYCVSDDACFKMVAQRVEPINDNTFRLFMINPINFDCFYVEDVNGENSVFEYNCVVSTFFIDENIHYTIFLDKEQCFQYLKTKGFI